VTAAYGVRAGVLDGQLGRAHALQVHVDDALEPRPQLEQLSRAKTLTVRQPPREGMSSEGARCGQSTR
jgi:hypothetical protein